ncbi:hypothetical protein GCM10009858_44060 [Terrabacter carboxydivorans]|uniref:Uncharacterized protein n=1 Tax=Terrabacter carboxydivorans TaxID=619730 RepID=A0ABP5ZMB2_9MICO
MGAERGQSLEVESPRLRLLREWLELQDQYDRALARRFYDTRGRGCPSPPGLEMELDDLAQAVGRAKAAYDQAKDSTA